MYDKIIREICQELNIKYTYLSKDWIIKLTKDDKVAYLSYNKFPLDNHPLGLIMDDKYALYDVLKDLNIPVCTHHIFYNENNNFPYAKGCHTKEDLLRIFDEFNNDVVIKPNNGAMGLDVFHITDKNKLISQVKKLLVKNFSISICPYYHIKNEYRIIILDNEIKLIYKKINPRVIGDGKSTLKELLVKFNPYYFKEIDVPNIIPNSNEEYVYDFHFNLSKGSIATTDIDKKLSEKLTSIAKEVTNKTGIRFASVDIVETTDNCILVLEVNSGVTIDKAISFIPNGYEVAKNIYKEAIIKLMNE